MHSLVLRVTGILLVVWAWAAAAVPREANAEEPRRPNIVLVLADDLGYSDLACYGAKDMQTPNLDQFAKAGLRLTSCYAGHANCSPSRTALMTGRTPTRVGIRNWIPHGSPVHVRKSEITIATLLKGAGYSTCHVGKWHMTGQFNEPGVPQPGEHGFDHWFSTQNNALPNHHNPDNFVRNGKEVGKTNGYSSHVVVEEAISWLRTKRDKSKPFFLYCCFHEPHEPIASDARYTKLYPHDDPAYSAHHGNITQMDDAFGRLMRILEQQGLADNTLVWFTSDNGPAITDQHPHGSSGPLRDKKGFLTEGGIRVPGMIRWPGKVKPGAESDTPICGVDFLPTVCQIVGIEPPQDRTIDGTSIVPVLSGDAITRREPLYWHFNRAAGDYQVALRDGDWKVLATLDQRPMVRTNDLTDEEEKQFKAAEPESFVLYNLKDDIGETKDLSTAEPEKLADMKDKLLKKYHAVREESPTWPAWTFDNREGQRIIWPEYVKNRAKGQKKGKKGAK